jgi:AcrR family transcriptional regulator
VIQLFGLDGIKMHPTNMGSKTTTSAKMGRPKGFREETALDAAMRVFWEKGYEGTSLDELTRAMNINRSSLYSTFGDKETLFRRVIDRYRAGPMGFLSEALKQPTARTVVESLLRSAVKFLADPAHPSGCLSLQGGLACGLGAETVKQAMIDWRNSGLSLVQKRMQQAQDEGDLPQDVDPKDLARLIAIVMNGLGVQAVNRATRAEMNRAVELALRSMPV